EVVVEVAANLFGGQHGGVQIYLPEGVGVERQGQQAHLDVVRNAQLAFQALAAGGLQYQTSDFLAQLLVHENKGGGQPAHFVGLPGGQLRNMVGDVGCGAQVLFGQFARKDTELLQGASDAGRQRPGHDKRNQQDGQEDDCEAIAQFDGGPAQVILGNGRHDGPAQRLEMCCADAPARGKQLAAKGKGADFAIGGYGLEPGPQRLTCGLILFGKQVFILVGQR